MNRQSAFLIHLLISVVFVGVVFAVAFYIWYPQPYYEVAGTWYLLRILLIVNLIVGPLLTLIVFKPGKQGLKLDLYVIGLFQVAALIYGSNIIYQERPYFMVFAIDRFELISRKDVDLTQIDVDVLNGARWAGLVPVFAKLPEDPQALSDFTVGVIYDGEADLERRPEFWHPYAERAGDAATTARGMDDLLQENETVAGKASQLIEKYRNDHATLGYVPLIGRTSNFSIALDMATGEQLEVFDIDTFQLLIDRQTEPDS